ncbi:hypothetical protein M9H77_22249 [Catharanthus roseus]|uniref:Uncharacterized protein n=1 Tax=Catharanthus roseus TaxID=4058 RepID=A0ACC0ATY9_CATRO|nr:hypothetical protein M9H77_22249 [Catharanthus roseus]
MRHLLLLSAFPKKISLPTAKRGRFTSEQSEMVVSGSSGALLRLYCSSMGPYSRVIIYLLSPNVSLFELLLLLTVVRPGPVESFHYSVAAIRAVCAQEPITHPQEVSALLAVRRNLNDPFNFLWNWKRKKDPCLTYWNGVICMVNLTDGYQHVRELRLFRFNLSGTLAPELGQLSQMSILDFMWNNISGSIPKEMGNITSLAHLLLSGNQISGPLPDELGNLPNLVKFQLDLNHISGPLPESFAKLPKVKHFHMNNNSISGQIPPQLYKLPLLQHL